MQSEGQQLVTFGNQQDVNYPQSQNDIHSITRKLWGSKPRIIAGMFQIFTGLIEVVLGIVVVALPSLSSASYYLYSYYNYDRLDVGGWGIWCGAFGILTGCFGLGSQRKKSMVTAYMVFSIIAAVLCAICILADGQSIGEVTIAQRYYDRRTDTYKTYHYNYTVVHAINYHAEVNFNDSRAKTHLILYILLLVSFFTQGLLSIIGASFTCGALCRKSGSTHQPVVYYQPTQAPVLVNGPAPPYVAAFPPQPATNLAYDLQYPTKN